MSKYIVLSFRPYDFQTDQGERVQGAKVSYLNRRPNVKEGEFGYPPLIVNITNQDIIKDIKEVPAIYEMEFEQVTGKNNKPELMLTSLEHVAPVDFTMFF